MTSASRDPKANVNPRHDSKGKDGAEKEKLTIYPDYCHGLSPTIGKYVPLAAKGFESLKDVGAFTDGRTLYHYLNHPIKWVKVTGIVVQIEEWGRKKVYTLDDSSGACIECMAVMPPKPLEEGKVPGHLDQFTVTITKPKTMTDLDKKREREAKAAASKKADEKRIPSVQEPIVPWDAVELGSIAKVKGKIDMHWKGFLHVEAIKIEVLRGLDSEVKAWNEVRDFRHSFLSKIWVVSQEEEGECRKRRDRELRKARKRREKEKDRDRRELRHGEKSDRGREKDGRRVDAGRDMDRERTKRKDLERVQKLDGVVRRRDIDIGGKGSLESKDKSNYPSKTARKMVAGKQEGTKRP